MQSKAIAHPVASRLLEIARHKVISAAKRAGISCKQTYAKEGKTLRRKAGGYAHAKQFKRLRKTVKRQRTILGVVMREVQRKLGADQAAVAAGGVPAAEWRASSSVSGKTTFSVAGWTGINVAGAEGHGLRSFVCLSLSLSLDD